MASDGVRASSPHTTGLYAVKPAFVARLRRAEDLAARRGVSPDALTVLGVALGLLTGAALAFGSVLPLLWITVPPLVLTRMACNAVDGSLARRTASTSRRGAVLNELGDRVADLATFGGLVPAVGPVLALGVALVAMSASFVAVTAQAVTGQRMTTGPMGKPDRVAVIAVAAVVALWTGPAALAAGAWMLIGLGAVTVVRRAVGLWRIAGETS